MSESYTIQPMQKEDFESIMVLLKKTFHISEPLNEAVELCDENGTCAELDEYCLDAISHGLSLSFKAVDVEGNIVGVTISGVCPLTSESGKDLLRQAERCPNPKFKKILYILANREESARLWEKFPQEKQLVDVKLAATDPNWGRRGIMTALIQETAKAVKEHGIKLLRMDTSSEYSAKSALSCGFTCVFEELYSKITRDGKPIIVPKAPHLYDRVHIKCLSD